MRLSVASLRPLLPAVADLLSAPLLGLGRPRTVRPAMSSASSVSSGLPSAVATNKALYVVALSHVLRGERSSPVTPATGLPRQLSGLLSGFLPTGTRPQARAKLGNSADMLFRLRLQEKIVLARKKICGERQF
jgi:hypothetical protein